MNRLVKILTEKGKADRESLTALYRKLALSLHPDKSHKGSEGFITLQKEYEEAVREISSPEAVKTHRKKTPPFYSFLESYLDSIDKTNIVLSLAMNPAQEKLNELLANLSDRQDLFEIFAEYRDLFHSSLNAILRYPSIRTAFKCLHSALLQLVQSVKNGDSCSTLACRTYLEETEELIAKTAFVNNSMTHREIQIISRLAGFVRDELNKHQTSAEITETSAGV